MENDNNSIRKEKKIYKKEQWVYIHVSSYSASAATYNTSPIGG